MSHFFTDIKNKFSNFSKIIKSLQTGLLLLTGAAGFLSVSQPVVPLNSLWAALASLFLAISGSTILNMWFDRDIDARMVRTASRPLPAGKIRPQEALISGVAFSITGISWAFSLDILFGSLVLVGLFFDVVIYTIWLKRRTAWAIIWGGISGSMPVLAGRCLSLGHIDWIGILLALAILLWIPTHILTFSMRHHRDYADAGVPTFPSRYNFSMTRGVIVFASLTAGLTMIGAALLNHMMGWHLLLLAGLSCILLVFATLVIFKPSERGDFLLYKYASVYMMLSMLLFAL